MAKKTLLLVVMVGLLGLSRAFEIKDCAGKAPDAKLDSIVISSCPDSKGFACTLFKGQDANLRIDFQTMKQFKEANIKIFAKLGFVMIPFQFPGSTEACGNYGFTCPPKVGDVLRMNFTLPILSSYPSIKATVRFELIDEKKQSIICFDLPVSIQKPPETTWGSNKTETIEYL